MKSLFMGRKPGSATPALRAQAAETSRHLLRAQEEERKRISRELHDEAGQGLMALRLYLAMLANTSENPENFLKVQEALGLLDRTIEDLRRVIARLSPRNLDELGLLAAITKEAHHLSKASGMKLELDLPESWDQLDHQTEVAVYRSVQEALHNIAKHSQARKFTVKMALGSRAVRLLVQDDGVGFARKGAAAGQGFGLMGMKDRIAALGGTVEIRSRRGEGTRIRIVVPVLPDDLSPELGLGEENSEGGNVLASAITGPGRANRCSEG